MTTENLAQDHKTSKTNQTAQFLGALFDSDDWVLLRFIESWIEDGKKKYAVKSSQHLRAFGVISGAQTINRLGEQYAANNFFGVCPRASNEIGKHGFDLSCQIPLVRCLWCDVDTVSTVSTEELLKRCKAADLPEPSILVNSGNGAHVYWLLNEPVKIPDHYRFGIKKEWLKDEKRYRYWNEQGELVKPAELLSPAARHVQSVIAGIAKLIGGDKTQDLARLLRLPGTLNRKDIRNGRSPKPCDLEICDPERRYDFTDFERFEKAAAPVEANNGKHKSSTTNKTSGREEFLKERLKECLAVEQGSDNGGRSAKDYEFLGLAQLYGRDQEEVWAMFKDKSCRLADRGYDRFCQEWEKRLGEPWKGDDPFLKWASDPARVSEKIKEQDVAADDEDPFPLMFIEDLDRLPKTTPQVEGHWDKNRLIMLYGPSNSGKSFVVLDSGLCIAYGVPLFGTFPVAQGNVVYICSEDADDLRKRIPAWLTEHGLQPNRKFSFFPCDFNFHDLKHLDLIIAKTRKGFGGEPDFVIVDPMVENFGGLNPRDGKDMTSFVQGCKYIRKATGATVAVVQHTGWDTSRERDASQLRGACSTVIKIEPIMAGNQQTGARVIVEKQRCGQKIKPYRIAPHPVETHNGESLVWSRTSDVVLRRDELSADLAATLKQIEIHLFSKTFGPQLVFQTIGETLKKSKATLQRHLKELLQAGFLADVGKGTYRLNVDSQGSYSATGN